MCGITVILSKTDDNIIKDMLNSLSILQNRGYDSVGITYKDNEKEIANDIEKHLSYWNTFKCASTETSNSLNILREKIQNIESSIAIGHTRWATHGAKTDINSHPHTSMNNKITLVHNGIINNFKELKDFLLQNNWTFKSDTDSEVIANLIEYYINENNSIERAIENTCNKLSGTWALAIVYSAQPASVYITRHGSPLLLGYDNDTIICTSEQSGFANLIYNYIVLDNHDIISITRSGYKSIKNNIYTTKKITNTVQSVLPTNFKHWTIKEIYDQPNTIMAAINNGARILNNEIILGGLNDINKKSNMMNNIEHVISIGCGTSYHACMMAKYYFTNFITVNAVDAAEFSERDMPKVGKIMVILCSQSGETRDLIKCIEVCKKYDCILVGVVNVVDSYIARSVDCGVYLNAGNEIAVASTKSFTSMLIVLSLIGLWFRKKYKNYKIIDSLRGLPHIVENLLYNDDFKSTINTTVQFIDAKNINSLFILGKEKFFPIAREIALKIKEICYIHAEGYSSSALKHGPFALLDPKAITLLLIDKKNSEQLKSTFYEITARNTHCIIITDDNQLNLSEHFNSSIITIPYNSYYSEIIFTIALQYLTYMLSVLRKIDPDKPRNLAKVVTVE